MVFASNIEEQPTHVFDKITWYTEAIHQLHPGFVVFEGLQKTLYNTVLLKLLKAKNIPFLAIEFREDELYGGCPDA